MGNFIAMAIFFIIAGLAIHVWHSNEQARKRPSVTGLRIWYGDTEITSLSLDVDPWRSVEVEERPIKLDPITVTLEWDD